MRRLGYQLTVLVALMLSATAVFAQNGKLKIKVTPKQAYVFVDGNEQPACAIYMGYRVVGKDNR